MFEQKRINEILLLSLIPLLMFCIYPVTGLTFRASWRFSFVILGGMLFAASLLTNIWLQAFWLLLLSRTAATRPVINSYVAIGYIAVGLLIIENIKNIDKDLIWNSMCIAALFLVAWAGLQRFGQYRELFSIYCVDKPTQHTTLAFGCFNANSGSVFLALCLPAFFRKWWFVFLLVIVPGLYFAGSLTGCLAALSAVIIYIIANKSHEKIILLLLLIVLIAGGIHLYKIKPYEEIKNSDRLQVWTIAAKDYAKNYIEMPCGKGLGSWEYLFPYCTESQKLWWADAHNEYIQIGFEVGPVILILIFLFNIY